VEVPLLSALFSSEQQYNLLPGCALTDASGKESVGMVYMCSGVRTSGAFERKAFIHPGRRIASIYGFLAWRRLYARYV
jgi:hypothetical protein